MDSAFEMHGATMGAAAALAHAAAGKQQFGWPSAPLPFGAASSEALRALGGGSGQLEDVLAQHMLLLDLEDSAEEGQSPPQVPQQQPPGGGPLAQQRRHACGPVTPSGFTPAEAYVDRQERTVFFAKCAPSASADAVARVFSAYGVVEEINVFRSWPSAKASRGCGLVVMATSGGASSAIEGLHHKYTWDGVAAPMVVERCCAARLGVKAATQSATRARRTAAANAARRAARAGPAGAWQAAFGGGPQASPYGGSPSSGAGSQPMLTGAAGAAEAGLMSGLLPQHAPHLVPLSQPLSAPLQLPPLSQAPPGAGAGDGGAPPCCPLSLQSAAQVAAVLEHAATLSALSGASIWLKPEPGGAPGTGLALSGSPGQLQAAASLIAQLLSVAACAPPAPPPAGNGWH
ncbi:MAG: hypothetical protein J3K34DRAFT_461856 [Monoraphidium minutum]|nr:MAG: hypothetical protein J3K34DRAFT_461856 [Monoraphidium minutum]